MSTPAQPSPSPAGDNRPPAGSAATPVDFGFEARLTAFWEKYRGLIAGACVLVLLIIVGRAGWDWLQERRRQEQAAAYAAATDAAQLKSFASAHEGAALAGVAHLRLADEAYAGRRFGEAVAEYERALAALEETVLQSPVRLGLAMATLKNGQAEAGRTALEKLAEDESANAPVRAEAAYHLASLAKESGATADLTRFVELINTIEPNGVWAQRGMMLRPTPAPETPATDDASSSIVFPVANP